MLKTKTTKISQSTPSWLVATSLRDELVYNVYSVATWLTMIEEGSIRLSDDHRPWSWSDDQIVKYITAVINRCDASTLLLWYQPCMPPWTGMIGELEVHSQSTVIGSPYVVLDGHQRLGALATAASSDRFKLNIDGGNVFTSAEEIPGCISLRTIFSVHGVNSAARISRIVGTAHAQRFGLDVEQFVNKLYTVMKASYNSHMFALAAFEIPSSRSLKDVQRFAEQINAHRVSA